MRNSLALVLIAAAAAAAASAGGGVVVVVAFLNSSLGIYEPWCSVGGDSVYW